MRILHIIPYMHPMGGGPPVVVDQFCRQLLRYGHEVHVLTTNALAPSEDEQWAEPYRESYDITILPAWRRHVFGYSPALMYEMKARALQADIVHVHNLWSFTNIAAGRVCQKLDVPCVVSTHGMLDPHSLSRKSLKKTLYGKLVQFRLLRRSNGIVFTHKEEERLARQSCPGLPVGYVVPLGTDDPPSGDLSAERGKLLARHPEWSQKQLILFLGRIHPKKGTDLLVTAFALLLRDLPDAHLVLAGPVEQSEKKKLQHFLRSFGAENSATWAGPVFGATKWALLSLATVFVLPSYQENFAITVAEAMRMGLPIILSERVNIWETVVASGVGLKCELTPKSIEHSLRTVLHDVHFREFAKLAGPITVRDQFTWPAATQILVDAYVSTAK